MQSMSVSSSIKLMSDVNFSPIAARNEHVTSGFFTS